VRSRVREELVREGFAHCELAGIVPSEAAIAADGAWRRPVVRTPRARGDQRPAPRLEGGRREQRPGFCSRVRCAAPRQRRLGLMHQGRSQVTKLRLGIALVRRNGRAREQSGCDRARGYRDLSIRA
jgi:hypothetical protein